MSSKLTLSYTTVSCLLDCVQSAIAIVDNGTSVLTMPCDNLEQEKEILEEYVEMFEELLEKDEWDSENEFEIDTRNEHELFEEYFSELGYYCPQCQTLSNGHCWFEDDGGELESQEMHCGTCETLVEVVKGEELKEMYYNLIYNKPEQIIFIVG